RVRGARRRGSRSGDRPAGARPHGVRPVGAPGRVAGGERPNRPRHPVGRARRKAGRSGAERGRGDRGGGARGGPARGAGGRRGDDRQRARGGSPGAARRVLARISLMGRFAKALMQPGLTAIAEVKRRSPSAGDLRPDADPGALAAAYERAGAAAVSILVDERFGGTWDDLRAARAAARLPLLAKGFFSTEQDLRTAKEAGADAALLLLRDLDDAQTRELLAVASGLDLETLVEAHDADELARAVALDAPVIGINARDLTTFRIDRDMQLRLVAEAPRGRVVVAESGIDSRAQGAAAELAGADAILVGSTLMRAVDPAARLAELLSRPLVKVCGLTRDVDVAVAAEAG